MTEGSITQFKCFYWKVKTFRIQSDAAHWFAPVCYKNTMCFHSFYLSMTVPQGFAFLLTFVCQGLVNCFLFFLNSLQTQGCWIRIQNTTNNKKQQEGGLKMCRFSWWDTGSLLFIFSSLCAKNWSLTVSLGRGPFSGLFPGLHTCVFASLHFSLWLGIDWLIHSRWSLEKVSHPVKKVAH